MGCWYGTCGVTNTPIHDGENAKLVFLRAKKLITGSGSCYANDSYEPISFAVTGKYEGYGSIELDDNDALNYLVYNMVCYQLGDQVAQNGNIQDLQSLIESVCVGDVDGISFMLVHSSVWTDLVEKAGSYVPSYNFVQKNGDMSYHELMVHGYETYITPCPVAAKFDMYMPQTNVHTYFSNSVASSIMYSIETKDDFHTDMVKHAAVDLCVFDNALTRCRMFWSPQSGAGSQNSDYELLKTIGKHVEQLEISYMHSIE